jgi:ATP-grasp ribosomal peptide maturase
VTAGLACRPRVLVLTAALDPTADMVLTHLHADGVPFLRVDPARFPVAMPLRGQIGARGVAAELDGVSLEHVRAVYYRRPGRFVFDQAIPLDLIEWCDGQARFGWWGILESLPAVWVNSPTFVHRAEYKPYQLARAVAAGLDIPATLVTNDPPAVAEFAAHQRHGIITKTLYARMPRTITGDVTGVVYTEPVAPERYTDPSIAATAHLFQERLRKVCDIRVTVVDEAVFATEIDNPGELDWRRGHDRARYRPHRLPESILTGVRRLMDSLGLVFGALDFVLTDQGYRFIEVNPNGQWGWIENRTGQPISRALADTLTRTPTREEVPA